MYQQVNGSTLDYVVGYVLQQQQRQQQQQIQEQQAHLLQQQQAQLLQQQQALHQHQQPQYQQCVQAYTLVDNFQPQPQPEQPQPIFYQLQPATKQSYQQPFDQPAPQQQDTCAGNQQQPKIISYRFELPRDVLKSQLQPEPPRLKPLTYHHDRKDLIFKPSAKNTPVFTGGAVNVQIPDFKPKHSTAKEGQCKVHAPKTEAPEPETQEKTIVTAMLIYPPPHEHHDEYEPEPVSPPEPVKEPEPEPEPMVVMPSPTSTVYFTNPEAPVDVRRFVPAANPEIKAGEVWRAVEPGSIPACAKCHM